MSAPNLHLLSASDADSLLRRDAGLNHPDSRYTEHESRAIRCIGNGSAVVCGAELLKDALEVIENLHQYGQWDNGVYGPEGQCEGVIKTAEYVGNISDRLRAALGGGK